MSPIRKSQRGRYPLNWKAISERIRFVRAEGRCECRGECGREHFRKARLFVDGRFVEWSVRRCVAMNGRQHPRTSSLVVLTVAHLDHTPENCDDANLVAMCQDCHLRYDRDEHARTRAARQREGE